MSAFKDMVARDIHSVFLDTNFFGEKRTVEYDGERYEDIPVVLMEAEEKDRSKLEDDHVQGLYFVSDTLQCALADLGGNQPEKGQRIRINDEEGGGGFFREFYVVTSTCKMGMLHVGLGAIDE